MSNPSKISKEVNLVTCMADRAMINRIARRAKAEISSRVMDELEVKMDLSATHLNGCKLDLQKLLAADRFNFAHDIIGIRMFLDRTTGRLTNFFVPRCAAKDEEARS